MRSEPYPLGRPRTLSWIKDGSAFRCQVWASCFSVLAMHDFSRLKPARFSMTFNDGGRRAWARRPHGGAASKP